MNDSSIINVINDQVPETKVVRIGELIAKIRELAKEHPTAHNVGSEVGVVPTLKQSIIGQAFKALGVWHPDLDTGVGVVAMMYKLGFQFFEPEVVWLSTVSIKEREGNTWESCIAEANERLRVLSEMDEPRDNCGKRHRFDSLMKKARQIALAYPDAMYSKVSIPGVGMTCSYTKGTCKSGPNGEGCLWGRVFKSLKLEMPSQDTGGIPSALQEMIEKGSVSNPIDTNDLRWCSYVQKGQDSGYSWSNAIDQADQDTSRRFLNNLTSLPEIGTVTDIVREDDRYEIVPDVYDALNDVAKDPVVASTIDPGTLPELNAKHAPNFTLEQLVEKVRQLAKEYPLAFMDSKKEDMVLKAGASSSTWFYDQDVVQGGPEPGTIIGIAFRQLGIKHPLIDAGHDVTDILESGFGFTSSETVEVRLGDGTTDKATMSLDLVDWLAAVQDDEDSYTPWAGVIKFADSVTGQPSPKASPPEKNPKAFDRLNLGPAKTVTKLTFEDVKKLTVLLSDRVTEITGNTPELPQDILSSLAISMGGLSRAIIAAKQGNTSKEKYKEEIRVGASYLVVIAQRLANDAGVELGDAIMDTFNRSAKNLKVTAHFKDGVLVNESAPQPDITNLVEALRRQFGSK